MKTLPRFLEKLKMITETTPYYVASWSKDGGRYEIHDKKFETEILSNHFDAKQCVLSFLRQLNYYGFRKVDRYNVPSAASNGFDEPFTPWAIVHPLFHRDSPELIYDIKRKTRKGKLDSASRLDVQEIREDLQNFSTNFAKDLKFLKQQVYSIQKQLAQAVYLNSRVPSPAPYYDYEASTSIQDGMERAFLKQVSNMSFPDNPRAKRKREAHPWSFL